VEAPRGIWKWGGVRGRPSLGAPRSHIGPKEHRLGLLERSFILTMRFSAIELPHQRVLLPFMSRHNRALGHGGYK